MSGESSGLNIDENAQPTPQTLDLNAWIAQGARAQRTVDVCINASLLVQREALAVRIEAEVAKAEKTEDAERTLSDEPALVALEREWHDLTARIQAASRPFTVKALNGLELKQTRDAALAAGIERSDVTRLSLWMIAAASVDPLLTVEQVEAIYNACGDAGIGQLATAVEELIVAGRVTPSAPFLLKSSPGTPMS